VKIFGELLIVVLKTGNDSRLLESSVARFHTRPLFLTVQFSACSELSMQIMTRHSAEGHAVVLCVSQWWLV